MGKTPINWKGNMAQTVTFIVTDDCNLRCKYCYITHKSPEKRMNLETAKKFVDYMLTADIHYADAVILDFIGGEPMLEAELISQICDYFKIRAYELNHPWYWNYRISICTNGVNYTSEPVQSLIKRNAGKISVTITIDGNKEKHDLQRIFPDGSGSFDTIDKGIDLWLSQFRGATKVTFSSDDLPLLKDSIIALWNRGITDVSSNVVFEDVWKEGDDKILEEQLKQLADYVIDRHLFDSKYYCTFFSDTIGIPYIPEEEEYRTYCGAGKTVAFSSDGRVFPCLRYYSHSLDNHEEWPIGSLESGIDMERVRPFMVATTRVQSDSECMECPIANGCAFCQGFNYDVAETPTNFHRAKYICKMHKARVRANEYYFAKLKNIYGIERENHATPKNSLYILLGKDYASYCSYENACKDTQKMAPEQIVKALEYSRQNFMRPIFVHPQSGPVLDLPEESIGYDILHIMPGEFAQKAHDKGFKEILPVFHSSSIEKIEGQFANCLFNLRQSEIENLAALTDKLLDHSNRINLYITELSAQFDEQTYRRQLEQIKDSILDRLEKTGELKEVNLLTDLCFMDRHDSCKAGDSHFTVAPNGQLYTCPAFYSSGAQLPIGNLEEGITRKYSARLYSMKNNPLCGLCDAYQCNNCVYNNYKNTNEVNVSPSFQCRKSHIERAVSQQLLEELKKHPAVREFVKGKEIPTLAYLDPIKAFLDKGSGALGIYQCKAD